MIRSDVNDIGILKSLCQALPQYCGRNFEIAQGFASILSKKMDYLESLESLFVKRVRDAENALRWCEIARSCDPPENRRSCYSQESALAEAQADYACYKSEMARLDNALASYKNSESKYANSLNVIKTQTLNELNRIIQHLSNYVA